MKTIPPRFNDAADIPYDMLEQGIEDVLEAALPVDQVMDSLHLLADQESVSNGAQDLAITCASNVEAEHVTWLWPGRIPRGKLTILEGDPGLGKSTLLYDLAARLSTASLMPDGAIIPNPGSTLILSAEDGVADTIVPRLRAAGADLQRVFILQGLNLPDATRRPLALPNDVASLREAIVQKGAELVIIDPLAAFLSSEINSYRDQDVRRALHPLKELAEELGTSILVCRHLTKGGAGGSAIYRGGGSIGIIGAARCCMIMARDPDFPDSGRVILAVSKSNLGALPRSLAFHVDTDDTLACSRIAWEYGEVRHTARDLCAPVVEGEEGAAIEEAIEFLREELADGARTAKEIDKSAREAAIAAATLRRAKKKLGVISQREPGGIGDKRPWLWSLPEADAPVGAHTRGYEHLRVSMSTYADSSKSEDSAGGQTNRENGDFRGICVGAQAGPVDAHVSAYEHLREGGWEEGEI